jgi:hypothetical protein
MQDLAHSRMMQDLAHSRTMQDLAHSRTMQDLAHNRTMQDLAHNRTMQDLSHLLTSLQLPFQPFALWLQVGPGDHLPIPGPWPPCDRSYQWGIHRADAGNCGRQELPLGIQPGLWSV